MKKLSNAVPSKCLMNTFVFSGSACQLHDCGCRNSSCARSRAVRQSEVV